MRDGPDTPDAMRMQRPELGRARIGGSSASRLLCWLSLVCPACDTSRDAAAPWRADGAPQATTTTSVRMASDASPVSESELADAKNPRSGPGAGRTTASTRTQPDSSGAAAETGSSGEMTTAPGAEPLLDPGVPPEVASHRADWPLPNWDYDNTRNPQSAIDSHSVDMLHEVWRFPLQIDSTAFGYFTANPLILGESVYVQDMMSNVYVLERDSGQVRWSRRFDDATFGPNGVAVGWGKLFAAVGDSAIVALDLDDGQDVWKFSPELGPSEGLDIQPVVYAGQLYAATVPVSTTRGVYEGGAHGLLLAVDAETGAQRWSFDTIDSADAWGDPDANGGGGAWYPPLIDARRGLTYWGTGNPVPWPGTLDKPSGASRPGANLYTSSLVAIGAMDGALRWHYQDRPHDIFDWDFQITPVRVRAAAASGADVIVGAGKTGAVAALDADSGELLWRTKVGRHENDELSEFPAQSITIFPGVLGGVMSALAYADGVVYVPSVDLGMSYDGNLLLPELTGGTGVLTALDVRDGSVVWTASMRGACYGSATVSNDLVLTSDETGRVYAFARDSGQELWHYDAPGGINAPLVVAGEDLLLGVGMDQGVLIGLSLHGPALAADAGATSGPAAGASTGAAGSGTQPPEGEPTFTGVYEDIIQRSGCSAGPACHGSTIAGQLKLSTAAEAYAALVGVKAMGAGGGAVDCSTTGLLRVAPNDPDSSLLVQKLESAMPVCGQHMPPAGMLNPAQLSQLRRWIENGANND